MRPDEFSSDLPPLVLTPFDQLTILAIDDHGPCLNLLETHLKVAGVGRVITAADVSLAVKQLTAPQASIDAIVCDYRLPEMTGLVLLQRIRAGRNTAIPRDLRFILATADASESLVRTAMQLDVNGFLLKPFGTDTVTKALLYAFSRPTMLRPVTSYSQVKLDAA